MPVRVNMKSIQKIEAPRGLDELDRVRLKKTVSERDRVLRAGLTGTIVLCHGTVAYEVEFDGIHDFFEVRADDLEKILDEGVRA